MQTKARRKKALGAFPLKQVLARYGWSQYRLVKASGLTYQSICALANGRTQPRWQTLLRIVTTIGADLGDFQPGKGGG